MGSASCRWGYLSLNSRIAMGAAWQDLVDAWVRDRTVAEIIDQAVAFRMTGVDRWVRRAAPTFGEHSREVLRDVLGRPEQEIEHLFRTGVVADRPRGL